MFKGAIPPTMRRILSETVRSWGVGRLAVGCSGNLTIERSLVDTELALSGNDVNIYTCTIGQALAGQDRRLEVSPLWVDEFGWLEPFLATPFDRAATIILASDMLDGPKLDRDPPPFFVARRAGYRHQWERLHAATVEKLRALPPLADWFSGDVGDYLGLIGDAPFASFPPFWGGGYEAMFANLSEVFDWDEPSYPTLTEDRIVKMLDLMMDRPHWCLGLLHRRDDLAAHYTARTTTVLGGLPIHVYTSSGPTRLAVARTPVAPVGLPTLTTGDELTGELELRTLTAPQFESLRRRYLGAGILNTAAPEAAWALCDAGRVLGAFAVQARSATSPGGSTFTRDLTGTRWRPTVYLLSDFAVAPTDYPRLSKLVAMAAVSREVHQLIEGYTGRRYRGISTTAFTDKPVSMKYRGVLDLVHRAENDGHSGSGAKYALNYHAQLPRWDLAEAWERWHR